MFSTIKSSFLIVLIPIFSSAFNCQDKASFTFGSYYYEGFTYTRNCKWLTDTPIKAADRIDKWCSSRWNGVDIGKQCEETCDRCPLDPNPDPDGNCQDDGSFNFGTYNRRGFTYTRTCKWITDTLVKLNARRSTWCNGKRFNGIKISSRCTKACNKCN
jgi:hypothetical protein